jgi:EpsI family protein
MLSIAYGVEQNKQSQVHRPDVCYPAQGFKVRNEGQIKMQTQYATIPVLRLIATQGNRIEPISYWIRVGDDLASGWVGQKIAVVKQGLRGNVADGLLFRVSSIDADTENAFPIQEQFIKDLLATVSEVDRPFLVGRP